MPTLPETFRDCKTILTDNKCQLCSSKLCHKKLEIDKNKFKGLIKFGINHKIVRFCSTPKCPFIEQGIMYIKDNYENFLSLKEFDALIEETIKLS